MLINGSTQKYKAKILLEKHSLVTFPTSETILSLRAERSEREAIPSLREIASSPYGLLAMTLFRSL